MSMEVDYEGELIDTHVRQSQHQPARLPVDDAHPFELDAYISNYSGRTVIDRLVHIISSCPTLAPQALQLAFVHIPQLRDPELYHAVIRAYDGIATAPGVQLPPAQEFVSVNQPWIEEQTRANQVEKTKLEVELKTYSNNMIKESIRMGYRDLGDFLRSVGDYSASLRHYSKSREYCTTSQHVLDMCLSVLKLLIEQRNYAHIQSYIIKAEAALESASAANTGSAPGQPSRKNERSPTHSKLDLASALHNLGQGNYERAATMFLRVGSADQLGGWVGKLISAGDIAVYGTLCALATLSRGAIKVQLLENSVFSVYIEQEPYVRDLVHAYMTNDFKSVLEILSRYSTRHALDIHLAPHIAALTRRIREVLVIVFLQPFATLALSRMATSFGWDVAEAEQEVVTLIQAGRIQARVDSQNKILRAKKQDQRAKLFADALRISEEMQRTNRKLLLRMRL
ncbi:G protein pathway suppressor 1 [Coniophora puteana RWD-64-598 SS2]|uniref:G protein pathway suppressor 1 n=1 Tax=Coniophora puteana (strain RWD-64-598) TaxID=741705 RepID=R7SF97_CONPW|nr:G protein pathway suppressor 1 [Coniophora puteana RWD-64-598 SS2]EIW74550.1 G protein pathway suppressor 1 [Coniophora puteana RWD-64-598 SS2]